MTSSSTLSSSSFSSSYRKFVLQGVGQLVPWNAIITAQDFFSRRLCDTQYLRSFEATFGFVYSTLGVLGLLLALYWPPQGALAARRVARSGLVGSTLIFLIFSLLVVCTSLSGFVTFWLSISLVALAALTVATSQSGMFTLAGNMSDSTAAFQGMMMGQGVAGLCVAIVRMATSLAGPDLTPCPKERLGQWTLHEGKEQECTGGEIDGGSLVYFLTAAGLLVACCFTVPRGEGDGDARRTHRGGASRKMEPEVAVDEIFSPLMEDVGDSDGCVSWDESIEIEEEEDSTGRLQNVALHGHDCFRVLKAVAPEAFSVCLVFTVTLSVFPGLTSLIWSSSRCDPDSSRLSGDLYSDLFFLLFNVGDLLGRMVTGKSYSAPSFCGVQSRATLPIMSVTRALFIPFFLLCRVQGSRLPLLFGWDAVPALGVLLLGLSNGFVSTLSMMAPKRDAAPSAGTVLLFFLSLGLMLGSLASYGVLWIGRGSLTV